MLGNSPTNSWAEHRCGWLLPNPPLEGKNLLKNGLGLEDILDLCLCSSSSSICTTAMFLDFEITYHMGLHPMDSHSVPVTF